MKQERIILSFIMVLIGLLVAGAAFYFYQSGKKTTQTPLAFMSPTPTQLNNKDLLLEITTPINEVVTSNKNIELTGKTKQNAKVIVITKTDQEVLVPDTNGKFKTNLTLLTDQNLITVIALMPDGDSRQEQITVTYSTANF